MYCMYILYVATANVQNPQTYSQNNGRSKNSLRESFFSGWFFFFSQLFVVCLVVCLMYIFIPFPNCCIAFTWLHYVKIQYVYRFSFSNAIKKNCSEIRDQWVLLFRFTARRKSKVWSKLNRKNMMRKSLTRSIRAGIATNEEINRPHEIYFNASFAKSLKILAFIWERSRFHFNWK